MTPPVTPPDAPRPGGPTLTLREAASATGLSLSTLRRRRGELVEHGARMTPSGAWEVPYAALIALGMVPRVTPPDALCDGRHDVPHDAPANALVTPPAAEVERLAARVRELEHQLELERVINRERERTIEAQQLALRAIEKGPTAAIPDPPEPAPTPARNTPEPYVSSTRGWRRFFGR